MSAIAKKNTKEGAASRSLHRSVALALTLILSWFAMAADSVMASDLRCNMNSSGQVTIADCLRQAFNQTDVELNERYQAILTALSTAGTKDANFVSARQRLIESQRSWIKFRDQDCKGLSTLVPDDPAIDSRNTACLIDRTQRRLLEFDAWESLLPGGRAAALIPPDANVGGAVEYARPDDAIAGQPLQVALRGHRNRTSATTDSTNSAATALWAVASDSGNVISTMIGPEHQLRDQHRRDGRASHPSAA